MSEAMKLSEQQLNQIGGYVKQNLGAWMKEVVPTADSLAIQNTFERVVRVEEELKASRNLMAQGFEYMEKRFEQVDKRFDEMRSDMLSRFEQVDKRFEQVDKRFEQVDKRFEQVDKRFERLTQVQSRMIAWLTLVITLVTGASTAITLLLGS